jgi:hypothetical protein
MGSHDPFGYLKHKLWPKEGSGVKLSIWFLTTKSQNLHDFLMYKWRATYRWKAFDEGYNFALNLTSIKGLHTKLWAAEVTRVIILKISGFPLGSFKTKWHSGVGSMAKHRKDYKGEGGGFPQVRALVSLMSPCLPMVRPCTKSVLILH